MDAARDAGVNTADVERWLEQILDAWRQVNPDDPDADEAMLQSAGPVALAGRVMAMRHHGKSCFAVLRDQSGQIQIYARADVLGPAYAAFVDLDVGDFIGVTAGCASPR